MAGAQGCWVLTCLLLAAAAQLGQATRAADQTVMLTGRKRQRSLLGGTHLRQFQVGQPCESQEWHSACAPHWRMRQLIRSCRPAVYPRRPVRAC